jgi:hypothetical protein
MFVTSAAAASAGAIVLPGFNIAKAGPSPNSKLNIAFVGGGGRGSKNLNGCKDENVVAICDVSDEMAAGLRRTRSSFSWVITAKPCFVEKGPCVPAAFMSL